MGKVPGVVTEHRRFRFSVRLLMLMVLLVGLWLGWRVEKARTQREAVTAVHRLGGTIEYDYTFDEKGYFQPGGRPRGPEWFWRQLGPEYAGEVHNVAFDMRHARQITNLSCLDGLTRLRSLSLDYASEITDAELIHLEPMQHLQSLWLGDSQVGDAGLARLKDHAEIEDLYLGGTRVTDAGLVHLGRMKDLRVLFLNRTKLSDAGLARLAGLKRLKRLMVSGAGITDQGLDYLMGLSRLELLDLDGTGVTDAGVAGLKRALPKLQVQRK